MAALSISTWVPIIKENFSEGRQPQDSAIQAVAKLWQMASSQHDIPRLANADVNAGDTLTDETALADIIAMYSALFNGKVPLSEAEVEDSPADAVESWVSEWMTSANIAYDNASIGVSAARSATATDKKPYTSIYKAIITTDNSGAVSYTANDNLTQTGSAGLTYAKLNTSLGLVENTKFWTPQTGVVLMHPGLLQKVRGILDTSGRPIFVESTGGFGGGTAGYPGGPVERPTLFGYPVFLTHGAAISGSYSTNPTGNKLLVFANRQRLIYGNRVAPESRFIDANINPSALQHIVQARARRGFVLTVPNAASVLEENL